MMDSGVMLFLAIVGAFVGFLSCLIVVFAISAVAIGEIKRVKQARKRNSQLQMRKDACWKEFLAEQERRAKKHADRPFMFYDQARETALNERQ